MKAITEPRAVEKYKRLAGEMMLPDEYRESEFRPEWIVQRGWKVVPVEDGNHFRPWEIDRIVPALQEAGYHDCVAVATEPMGPRPSCFQFVMTADDLRAFNGNVGYCVSCSRKKQGRGPSPATSCTTFSPVNNPSWKQCSVFPLKKLEGGSWRSQRL